MFYLDIQAAKKEMREKMTCKGGGTYLGTENQAGYFDVDT